MISLPVSDISHRRLTHQKLTDLPYDLPQLSFVISSIYWSLILLLPQLILPPPSTPGAIQTGLPLPLDLALHASPLFTLLIDFFVFESKFSKTYVHRVAPAAVVVFTVWYASFVEYCATFNGFCECHRRPHSQTTHALGVAMSSPIPVLDA